MYFDIIASGRRIKQLRKAKGLTQEQLSEQLNISVGYLGRLEAGQYGGSIDLLIDISTTFGVSLDYLILGKPSDKNITKQKLQNVIQILISLKEEI